MLQVYHVVRHQLNVVHIGDWSGHVGASPHAQVEHEVRQIHRKAGHSAALRVTATVLLSKRVPSIAIQQEVSGSLAQKSWRKMTTVRLGIPSDWLTGNVFKGFLNICNPAASFLRMLISK